MKNIITAIVEAGKEIPQIGKNLTVGAGNSAYKGVSWKDVASAISPALKKHGLVIIPTSYDAKTKVTEYVNNYGKPAIRVMTEVNATYTVYHTSGESLPLAGFGYGIDSQDKGAGKATTYAYKNAVLYMFTLAAEMDDTDTTHSDDMPVPPALLNTKQVNELMAIAQGKKNNDAVKNILAFYKVKMIKQVNAVNFQVVKTALEGIK